MKMVLMIALLSVAAVAEAQTPCKTIVGTWREVEFLDGNKVSTPPGPSLYLFTDTHYSVTLLTNAKPRQPLVRSQAGGELTNAEKLAAYEHWSNFTAQAGTYRVTEGKLVTKPLIAKNEAVMSSPEVSKQCIIEKDGAMVHVAADGSRRKLVRVQP